MSKITATTQRNLDIGYLEMAANHFDNGDEVKGKLVFLSICREPHRDEHGVYDQIARLQGFPLGSTQEGKLYFFDLDGKSTPSAQKAEAIRAHMRSLNLQGTQIPSLLAQEEIEEATTESDWSGYKKAALVGLGLVSAGLVIGVGVYIYRQRSGKCDDEQEGASNSANKDLDDLIEKGNAIQKSCPFPYENSSEMQPIPQLLANPVFTEELQSCQIGSDPMNLHDRDVILAKSKKHKEPRKNDMSKKVERQPSNKSKPTASAKFSVEVPIKKNPTPKVVIQLEVDFGEGNQVKGKFEKSPGNDGSVQVSGTIKSK